MRKRRFVIHTENDEQFIENTNDVEFTANDFIKKYGESHGQFHIVEVPVHRRFILKASDPMTKQLKTRYVDLWNGTSLTKANAEKICMRAGFVFESIREIALPLPTYHHVEYL